MPVNQWIDDLTRYIIAAIEAAPLPDGFDAREVAHNDHGSFVVVLQRPDQVTYAAEFRVVK